MEQLEPGKMALVIVGHEALTGYKASLSMSAGEEVKIGRRDDEWPGWVFCEDLRGGKG